MEEVGSASGVMEAVQQLSTALGVAVLGTIFFATFGHQLRPHALRSPRWSAWCHWQSPSLLVFRLPMHPRPEQDDVVVSGGLEPSTSRM